MSSILVVTGSVRPNSVNEKIVPIVVDMATAKGADVTVANLGEINLPFFDNPVPPASPDFAPTDERVQAWTDMVSKADGVILVTPEYNHTMTPVQLNAIDWISKEWADKPVGLVGYGWGGAQLSHATAREVLAVNLKARVGDNQASLFFMQDLAADGSVTDQESVDKKIGAAIDEVLKLVEK